MGIPAMYLTLSFFCFCVFSSVANTAEDNNNTCSATNREGKPKAFVSYYFHLAGRCFEFTKETMTWRKCADYCRSSGGMLAKLDELTLTPDTAEEFAKGIGLKTDRGNEIHVGLTTTTGTAKWMDGTKVTVPDVEAMIPGFCGRLLIDNIGDGAFKYIWTAFTCLSLGHCLCEYEMLVETTTEVPVETTTDVSVETTTEAPVDTTTEVPIDTTTEVPTGTTTDVPVDTTTEAPVDTTTAVPTATTTDVPVDTTTRIPVDTTSAVPTGLNTKVPTITTDIRDAHEDNCTADTRTSQTNWRVGRRKGTERKSVQTVYKWTKDSTYITAKAFAETKCAEVTMCPRLCSSDYQCVSYNYNTVTGECRLFHKNHDRCLERHTDWHVWDQVQQ